jgi:hypothetical protein
MSGQERFWFVSDWQDFDSPDYEAYRIYLMETPHGMFQTHEWRKPTGESHLQCWIPTTASAADGYEPCDEPKVGGAVQLMPGIQNGIVPTHSFREVMQ